MGWVTYLYVNFRLWSAGLWRRVVLYTAEVLKLWGVPLGGRCWSFGGARFLYEGHIYLDEIWTQDKIYILKGTLFGWNILLTTQYRYWLRTISSTFCRRLKSSLFRRRNTPTNKNEVTLLSQIIFVSYCYADERNYCTLCFVFIYRDNIPYHFPSCVVRSAR
jgi:hypothetical protein